MAFWGDENKESMMEKKDLFCNVGRAARRAFRPAMSALLAFVMLFGSIPSQAYAEMIDEAARAVAMAQAEEAKTEQGAEAASEPGEPAAEEPEQPAAEQPASEGDANGAASDDAKTDAGKEAAANKPSSDSKKPAVKPEEEPVEADITTDGELTAAQLSGDALSSPEAARAALSAVEGADPEKAVAAADTILDDMQEVAEQAAAADAARGSEADGSSITSVKLRWLSEDSWSDGEKDKLSVRPSANEMTVKLRLSYAMSGQYNYGPGEVFITVPADMFKTRAGENMGTYKFPVPEEPSTNGTWNYKRVGDDFVFTNTRRLSAATNGYIEFSVSGLKAVEFKDMQENGPYDVKVSALTNKGNTIEMTSDPLTMVVDTGAKVIAASKTGAGVISSVAKEKAPQEAQKKWPDEEEFVVVNWMTDCEVEANQPYVLKVKDELQPVKDTEGKEQMGLLVVSGNDATVSADGTTFEHTFGESTRSGRRGAMYFKSVYPKSWFGSLEENSYTFKNSVTYTVIESDDAVGSDPKLETKETARASDVWTKPTTLPNPDPDPIYPPTGGGWIPQLVDPRGDIDVYKHGNSGDEKSHQMYSASTGTGMSDLSDIKPSCYGMYPSALNKLRDGRDVPISYTLKTEGYLMPWTYEAPKQAKPGTNPNFMLENYGKRNVKIVTEDSGLRMSSSALEVGTDYVYNSIEFPRKPTVYHAVPVNLTPNGMPVENASGNAHFDYELDSGAEVPPVKIQVKQDGAWSDYATVSWPDGVFKVEFKNGKKSFGDDEGTVRLPADTEAVRMEMNTKAPRVFYHARVNFTLKGDGSMHDEAAKAFEGSFVPQRYVYNDATVLGEDQDGKTIIQNEKTAYDRLVGYSAGTRVYAEKTAGKPELDNAAETITIRYNAKVHEETFIAEKQVYEDLVAQGEIKPNTGGAWYDLLPKGMMPVLDTVQVRNGDRIRQVYTIENYKDTGRTMLVVAVDLTPSPERYKWDDALTFYRDSPSITFEARCSFDDWRIYYNENTKTAHNVVAFESEKDEFGSMDQYRGEANDPRGGNNAHTAAAFRNESDAVKDAMTDLKIVGQENPRKTNSFVYAGAFTSYTFEGEQWATGELDKKVMVNNDGTWGDGLKGDHRDVYSGGAYSYRLSYIAGFPAKNLKFYDTLEAFKAGEGNESEDVNASSWQGVFKGIDVSPLEDLGCDPKVYISTKDGIEFSEGQSDNYQEVEENTNFDNGDVWKEISVSALNKMSLNERKKIKAIGIDASKAKDGSEFILKSKQTASALVHMQAPRGDEAKNLIEQNAHAYNNVHLKSEYNSDFVGRRRYLGRPRNHSQRLHQGRH